ncbi:NADP(H)-dependent aldo-keto reductase [Acinetobacter qingfengensis]|uniref:Protein tas n=1 Tax=Acinetobacter qingfengensis TaxID=1262585 RepID=A0A1E7RDF6_9GAMM|nr:NADP(H)-dependent aldo-keto reductase [Acinetobacter qingfengensis]KAA8735352.1 NADP(H)-dependent aldo-keto reductase [Acinetobacter qingfengensis]OEY97323.1 aldo/keto reductase [Acinetobacter qingfengensis]
MRYNKLGQTNIDVSAIALGTMTWGEQNTEQEAHQQIDFALAQGINFIDTAELYPVPPKPETQGLTEQYIGTWLAKFGQRDKIILASKVVGPSSGNGGTDHFRNGQSRHNKVNIEQALHDSLTRLQTDYLDLYQLHWPDRHTNFFGQLGYSHLEQDDSTPILETLSVLNDLVQAGKIRHIGLSNETPWGISQFLHLAEKHDLARVVSVQNPYNLLNRTYEIGTAEISIREHAGLLAYSPLAFGHLTGKYLNGALPEGARITKWQRFSRYKSENAIKATELYVALAKKHGIDPAQLALAFINQQPFVTSNIIGATNLQQLKTNIDSIDVILSEDILAEIANIHQRYPNPSP